jgi:hypothetical protein
MPSELRDPKTLSQWLELDAFKRPRRLRRWRRPLGWIILLAGSALLSLSFWPRVHFLYQAGPVSAAHASFNEDCAKCHSESFQTVKRLWSGDQVRSVEDSACTSCHPGPPHHEESARPDLQCAECHQEHRGRAKLADVADGYCTSCHADQQTKNNAHRYHKSISTFADHPFDKWRPGAGDMIDPGQIKFNHHVHLNPEGVLLPNQGKEKLDCSSCHQSDDAGRYMRKINYYEHCRRCHPLSVSVGGDDRFHASSLVKAAAEFRQWPAPHVEPKEVRAAMRQRFTDFVKLPGALDVSPEPLHDRPIPGRRFLPSVTEKEWQWVNDRLSTAEEVLFRGAGGCTKCHIGEGKVDQQGLLKYRKTAIRDRWFPHSLFSHKSHQMLICGECHKHGDQDVRESRETSDVLIPAVESCRQCHSPKGGARQDCVECHAYHQKPTTMIGGEWTIDAFLGKQAGVPSVRTDR